MRKILYLLALLLISLNGNTQPPCGSNPPAGEDCANATPICELNGYCGNTYSYVPNAWGSTGAPIGCGFLGLFSCPGTGLLNVFCGSVENDSYLKFVASATSISFNVWVTSSVYGDGIQLIVFSTPSCGNNTVNAPYCQQILPGAGPTNVSVSGLIVGNTYYIMIDGFAGDLCNYVIGANTGIAIPVDVTPLTSTICNGDNVSLTASGGNGTYTWNASADLNTTSGAAVVATPPGPGTYSYTVNSATGNPLCPSSTLAVATIIVNNCGCTVNATNSGNICVGGGLINLFATNVVNATYSWTGPGGFTSTSQNPTGITPPLIAGSYTYTVTATVLGVPCSSTTTLVVNPLPTVSAGIYPTVCSDAADVALVGSPVSGVFSGTGVTGNNFDPSAGTQTITYSYTDGNGCSNNASTNITIVTPSAINPGSYTAVCSDASDIVLVGTPASGTFSGVGVTGNNFDPSVGTQIITYSYFDAIGCGGTATTTITVNPLPLVSAGNYSPVCSNITSVPLVGSPIGGTFSGTGVSGASFNTSSGTQTITYIYTDGNSCSNSATATITVNNLPVVTSGSYGPYCVDGTNVSLIGTPAGGIFSGMGVTGNNFDPSAGTQTITFSYTDGNGCSNSTTTTINVINPSTINPGSYAAVCIDASDIAMVGTPAGGTFSGVGVTGNNFDPSVGTQIITYSYFDAIGCGGTANTTITVNPLPAVSAGNYTPVCSNITSVPLVGSPIGGTFSGTGVSGINFNPSSGTQTITYTYTDVNSCSNSATATITVNNLPVVTSGNYGPYCVDAANVSLIGTPAGGIFSGVGVTGNSFDPSVGNQTIVYVFTDVNGCVNTSNTSIQINQLPIINGGSDLTICLGTSSILSGSGGSTYSWSNGIVNGQSFTPTVGNTIYTVTGTDVNGCVNTDVISINVLALPVANVSADINIGNPTLTVTFTNTSTNSINYIWDFGNGSMINTNLSNQTNSYPIEGTYLVTLAASNGTCTDIDSLYINVIPFPAPIVHVPNVFTPNEDGANDEFFIDTQYASQIEIFILNRWGNIVFESTDLTKKWDGRINGNNASEGVYFFKYSITGVNSEIVQGHGNITLIR